jgi:hypothetical protein
MCTVLLPPGVNPAAVKNKYTRIYNEQGRVTALLVREIKSWGKKLIPLISITISVGNLRNREYKTETDDSKNT